MTKSPSATSTNRALALDALRGLAILAMLLSGQLPFDGNALPSWMYHAQEPPPAFMWSETSPAGISWVDLVFPFFLFSMGAAFPLALSRRMDNKASPWKLLAFIGERGLLLGFFALFVQAIRPYTLSRHPDLKVWLIALLGFFILFPILTRLPDAWSATVKITVRAVGWIGAGLFFLFATYPDGSGFKTGRSDIIIIVLTNMAVFGSLVWMLTRNNLLLRLGVIGIVFAIRLSNMPTATEGWVHDLWRYSPLPWIYQLYYLQYLCIVIPGTIAGDLILQWTRRGAPLEKPSASPQGETAWPMLKYFIIGLILVALLLDVLIGLKARWLLGATLIAFALCLLTWILLQKPLNETERLYNKLFNWSAYWLVLGLVFEPYEGGIKKDHPTLSYYFVTSGLAICVFICFSIFIDVFRQKRWVALLVENGQNPMIAYAGINNFITPVLALIGADRLLTALATSPWLGFCKGLIITLLMAITVSFLTRRKIFWRT